MPLLNPVIPELDSLFAPRKRGKAALDEILSNNGLSLEETITELKSIVDNTTDLHLKSKILDIVLGLHGVKKDTGIPVVPNITFVFPQNEPSFLNPAILIKPEEDSENVLSEISQQSTKFLGG